VLGRIFGPKRDEVTGEWRKLHSESFIIWTRHQISLSRSNQGEWGGRGMWHAWQRGQTCTGFRWGKPEGKSPLERPRRRWEVGIKMDLREIGWGLWSGFFWLRIGTVCGLLWMRWWTFGFWRQWVKFWQN
jgi:hypothetical protein